MCVSRYSQALRMYQPHMHFAGSAFCKASLRRSMPWISSGAIRRVIRSILDCMPLGDSIAILNLYTTRFCRLISRISEVRIAAKTLALLLLVFEEDVVTFLGYMSAGTARRRPCKLLVLLSFWRYAPAP
jgi:hypothetical protein